MRHLTFIILIGLTLSCSGQTKESFLNQVFKSYVDTQFTKYYLHSDCQKIIINEFNKTTIVNDLCKHVDKNIVNELVDKSSSDTLKLNWECKKLKLAECRKTSSDILWIGDVITIDRSKSEAQQKKDIEEQEKQNRKEKEKYDNKPLQEREIYYFSRPIFDNTRQYAIICMGVTCGSLCGHRCIYLFKNVNGKWTKIAETDCYLS